MDTSLKNHKLPMDTSSKNHKLPMDTLWKKHKLSIIGSVVCILIVVIIVFMYLHVYVDNSNILNDNDTTFNKTIYMTYKNNNVPDRVFERWRSLNVEYAIDFSDDVSCINFLKTDINTRIMDIFNTIDDGRYKSDLWRLYKLYMHGGVYADIDIVPSIVIDTIMNTNIDFYSCLAADRASIFQAFMISRGAKNPLVLAFMLSITQNKPFDKSNGPTYDMYNVLRYNIPKDKPICSDVTYVLHQVRVPIRIGSSNTNTKRVCLYYFPQDTVYEVQLVPAPHSTGVFEFDIVNDVLIVTRTDTCSNVGWTHDHTCDIILQQCVNVYLLNEHLPEGVCYENAYVMYNGLRVFDCRDTEYVQNNRSWKKQGCKDIYMCNETLEHMEKRGQLWVDLNPSYKVHLYDNDRCTVFLLNCFGQDVVDIFEFIPDGPIKADLWRVCVLYWYGGTYVDADIIPLVPICTFIDETADFVTCNSFLKTSFKYNPNFINSKRPKNAILYDCISCYKELYKTKEKYTYWRWSIMSVLTQVLKLDSTTEGIYHCIDYDQRVQIFKECEKANVDDVDHVCNKNIRIFNNRDCTWDQTLHRFC